MKRHLSIFLSLTITCLIVSAQKHRPLVYDIAYNYFIASLSGTKTQLPIIKSYNKTDSTTIWQAWKQAIAQQNDGLLPPLSALSDNNSHSWIIPDSLEPNATLNFYYGHKREKPLAGWPLYLYLHGSGDRNAEWATGKILAQEFDDSPCAYFIPQIPQEGEWYRWYQQSKQWFIEKLLQQAMAHGDIDPFRIYLFGISEGGYGSQRLASYYADYLAAAGPMAAGEPLRNAPAENCGHIGFSLLTGDSDFAFCRNKLTSYTLEAFDSLKRTFPDEYQHRIKLLKGYGHSINYSLTTPWLKTFTRNPYPKHFVWEDFDMDHRHRNGFYNILVNNRFGDNADKRTRYEQYIHGNEINLTIQDIDYTCIEKDSIWGIATKYQRTYTPSKSADITLFLNNKLIDLTKKITVYVNNNKVFHGRIKSTPTAMIKSIAIFGDPLRMFPAAIDIIYNYTPSTYTR